MSEKEQKNAKRFLRVLRRSLLALAVLLTLCAALILSLPMVISSTWMRSQVSGELTKATGKPAKLDVLSFNWGSGLRLEGLQIGQGELSDPDFLVRLGALRLDFSLLSALRGDLRLELALSGLRLRVPPADPSRPLPPEPPAKPLPEALRGLFESLRTGLKPSALSLDAHVRANLTDMTVRLEPAPGGKAIELRDITCTLVVPGLKAGPITLQAGLDVFADGKRMAPVRLDAKMEGLADSSGRLAPAQASLTAKASAPGFSLSAEGSLAKALRLDLRAQLREAAAPARSLAPLPEMDGSLSLALTLTQPAPDRLTLALVLAGEELRAAHGPLGDKAVGPLSLTLLQEAELDLKAETLHLPGSLNLKHTSQVRWLADLLGVSDGKPRLTLAVRPLHLALGELLPALRAFLPPGLSLGTASLDAAGIEAAVLLPQKPDQKPRIEASVSGLDLTLRNILRRDAAGSLSVSVIGLRLESANATLPGSDPGLVEANLTASVDGMRLVSAQKGATEVSVRQFSLPRVSLRVDEFLQNPEALFGVTGRVLLELAAQARDFEAKGKAQVPELGEETRLRVNLPPAKSAQASLEALNLSIPVLRVLQPGRKPLEAPLTLRASAQDIRLSGPAPMAVTLHDMALDLDLGEALRCAAKASLAGSAGRDLKTDGRLSLDARKLLALAAPFAPRQAKASGGLAVDWKLAATLPPPPPEPAAKPTGESAGKPAGKAPAPAPKKLSQTLRELNFLHEAEAVLTLSDLNLDWPQEAQPGQPAETLSLRGLSTPKPLRLTTREGLRESSLTGSLAFGPMDALPGLGRLAKPLRGLMTVNAAQQGVRSVQVSEILHLDGFELDQNLSLVLDKLDTVLDRDADRLAAVLELVDASLAFHLSTGLQALPAQAEAKGISGKGRLEAGADLRLTGGRSLSVSALLLSPGLDLRLGPDMAVSGLTSNLRFRRRFSLAPGLRCPGELEAGLLPLSEQVFDQFPASGAQAYSGGEALGQLLRTDAAGPAAAPSAWHG